MLINYLDELNEDRINKIPEPLLKVLSSKLPDGLKYDNVKNGICCIVSEGGSLYWGGLEPIITKEMNIADIDKKNINILLQYSYNSQKVIKFKPIIPGVVTLNGESVNIKDLVINPRYSEYFENGEFLLIPEKMDEKIELSVGGNGYSRNINFKRIPNDSYDIVCFESYGSDELKFIIKYNNTSRKVNLRLSYHLENIRKVKDVVEVLEIFSAFKNNKGMLDGNIISVSEYEDNSHINNDTLWFWKRVRELEQFLDTSFDIDEGDYGKYLTEELVEDVELLYKSFIQQKPIRINSKIDKINGDCESDEEVISVDGNTPMLLNFQMTYRFNLFGNIFECPSLIYVFNARYIKKDIKDGKYTIYFDDIDETEKMYYSIMFFLNKDMLVEYENKNDDLIEMFKEAENKSVINLVE